MMNGTPPQAFTAAAMPRSSSSSPPMPRLQPVIAICCPCAIRCAMPAASSLALTSPSTSAMWSDGKSCRTRAIGGSGRRGYAITSSDDFTNFVLDHGADDRPRVFLPLDERFAEFQRLIGGDMAGHRRLVRIDDRLNNNGSGMFERRPQRRRRFI